MTELGGRNRIIRDDIDRIAQYVPHERDERDIQNARFFISGATGFVGVWLLSALLRLNEMRGWNIDVTILSRNPEKFAAEHPDIYAQVSVVKGDIVSFAYPDGNFDYMIHAATDTGAQANRDCPIALLDSILLGTKRFCELAGRCSCKKMLYVSSGAVYGRQPEDVERLAETYPGGPDPTDPTGNHLYGGGKRAGELIASLYAKTCGFEMKIARLFSFVGPLLPTNGHFAIGNFIRDVVHNGPIVVNGDGTPVRSYMYAADMALWLLTVLFNGRALRAYNVGSDQALSIEELARLVAECGENVQDVQIKGRREEGPVHRYVPSIERAKGELGLALHFNLNEAIERTMESLR